MITLPTEKRKAITQNPKFLILAGKPKSGKSTFVASLDDCLCIDLEQGYRSIDALVVEANTIEEYFEILKACQEKAKQNGGIAYDKIVIDNSTRLETLCLAYAAKLYRNTPMGSGWETLKDDSGRPIIDPKTRKPVPNPKADVRLLPNGAGWGYVRQAITNMIDFFRPLCNTIILVCHLKFKTIKRDDTEVEAADIDLAGKTGTIMCGLADAIGLIYREGNKTYLDFNGGDDYLKGARPLHLRNKKFCIMESDDAGNLKIDSSKIFLKD